MLNAWSQSISYRLRLFRSRFQIYTNSATYLEPCHGSSKAERIVRRNVGRPLSYRGKIVCRLVRTHSYELDTTVAKNASRSGRIEKMNVRTLKIRRAFFNYRLRRMPIIVASLLMLSIAIVAVAGQAVAVPFTVSPSVPAADQPLTFFFDASSVGGKVIAIVVLAGHGCSPEAMLVTTLPISPVEASGSVSLHSGLGAGQYSAIAFIIMSETGQSATEITSCRTFTVS